MSAIGAPEVHALADLNGTTTGAVTRRQAREAYELRAAATTPATRAAARTVTGPAVQASASVKPKSRLRRFASGFVLLAAAAIVGTIAIPAYAFNPSSQGQAQAGSSVVDTMKRANAQSADVAASATSPNARRDGFNATSTDEIAAQKVATARAAAAAKAAAETAAYRAAYSGPTATQYVAEYSTTSSSSTSSSASSSTSAASPSASASPAAVSTGSATLSNVLATAQKYVGTPYVYGGATPAGFDCSGFVMFVYAQYGLSLPHSASAQGSIGQTVSLADAQPGDVIALNDGSHDGFYAGRDSSGNVLILDAPRPGKSVGVRAIWTSAYHIQHYPVG